ncbi:MAG: type II toxin-antitoxin system prevent-host-death family antitoxin [Acidiferrobacter thiooxydans]
MAAVRGEKPLERSREGGREGGPQTITVHGREAVDMFSAEAYRKLTERRGSLVIIYSELAVARC